MTVTGALVAVITRKVRALIAEVRALVNKAKALEQAKVKAAEAEVLLIKARTEREVSMLRNDLITRINSL